jgi:hypothetical protein
MEMNDAPKEEGHHAENVDKHAKGSKNESNP